MLPAPISPSRRVLMGPGPSDVPHRVLAALAAPTVGHLDPEFLRISYELQGMVRPVLGTRSNLAHAVTRARGRLTDGVPPGRGRLEVRAAMSHHLRDVFADTPFGVLVVMPAVAG